MIGGNLPGSFWKKNFGMSKDLFHELAAELVPYIAPNPSSPNYHLLITTSLPLKCGLEQQKAHLPKRRKKLGTS